MFLCNLLFVSFHILSWKMLQRRQMHFSKHGMEKRNNHAATIDNSDCQVVVLAKAIVYRGKNNFSTLKWATYYQRFVSNELASCFSSDEMYSAPHFCCILLLVSVWFFLFFLLPLSLSL